jgi:hypothetical protein
LWRAGAFRDHEADDADAEAIGFHLGSTTLTLADCLRKCGDSVSGMSCH